MEHGSGWKWELELAETLLPESAENFVIQKFQNFYKEFRYTKILSSFLFSFYISIPTKMVNVALLVYINVCAYVHCTADLRKE